MIPPAPLLRIENLSISFGGIRAVDGVSLSLERGMILSIIGPNGAGKTTLFNLISGLYTASSGAVYLGSENVTGLAPEALAKRGMSRSFQNLQIFFRMSALENVMVGRHLHEKHGLAAHLLALPSVSAQNRESQKVALECLDRVGLADIAGRSAGALSYGALKRLEIARALASEPKVLLLDEPAAGCNPVETEEVDQVIHTTAKSGIGILLVEHDMKLVMRISDRVLVLDRGKPLVEGTPETVRNDPRVVEAYLGTFGAKEAARA